jgi:hypothetical protein
VSPEFGTILFERAEAMIHHVFANKSNAGDWLSARGIQSQLTPHEIREYFCDVPFVPETLAKLAGASREDLVVIGGGGLLMDYFAPFWEGFLPLADRLRFCLWGVGVCEHKSGSTAASRELLVKIIRKSRACYVRDELTRNYLAECQLPAAVPCPALLAVRASEKPGWGVLHVDHLTIVGEEVYERMCEVGREFAGRTGRPYAQINNLIPAGKESALQAVLDKYAAADVVLSSRLHGCILGLASGRKVVAVSGDRKLESFMDAAGLTEWVCDRDDISRLPERLESLGEQQVPTAAFLSWARRENERIGREIASMCER